MIKIRQLNFLRSGFYFFAIDDNLAIILLEIRDGLREPKNYYIFYQHKDILYIYIEPKSMKSLLTDGLQ